MEEKKELKVNPALLQFTYRKLIDYLQRDQNFTLENLNRSTLAKILDSNEKYLCMAVRKYSKEKTLKKLIEGMRMKYAASLLLEYMNYPVDEMNEPEETEETGPTDKNLKTEPALIGMGLSNLKQL